MGALIINGHILIESPAGESNSEFCVAIENMVLQAYGRKPDWLRFSVGTRFVRGGRHFREFVCIAGSVALMLMQRARRDEGFDRNIIYSGEDNGVVRAFEIRAGEETEFGPDELQRSSEAM